MQQTYTIEATLKSVSQFTEELEQVFGNLPLKTRTSVVLAMQELCVNIVEHAYDGISGQIEIMMEWDQGELNIVVMDDSPTEFQEPSEISLPDPLDLPEGGMGLFIIYESFDDVTYTRLANRNQWELKLAIRD